MVYRCILPQWAAERYPDRRRVREGQFTPEYLQQLNDEFYNIYFLPNYPSVYDKTKRVDGSQIDRFNYVYVDMDLKEEKWASKDHFVSEIQSSDLPPSLIVDSGNGIHVYWEVSDLDAMSYLRISRRLMRRFKTDEAVGQIYQLMRVPGTLNTKKEDDFKPCEALFSNDRKYTCEELDKLLPTISLLDEEYCKQHYDKTYRISTPVNIDDKLPAKFANLLRNNAEVKKIWAGDTDDRSKADMRLGHILFASGFTKPEALSVLVNVAKALDRAPIHRINYASNIADKIWPDELLPDSIVPLSRSVKEILAASQDASQGQRFPCWGFFDGTYKGFRLGQVLGLVAGSGVGKTAVALEMFEGFVTYNPEYVHLFIPLEQPAHEIAERWQTRCGTNTTLHEKVHIMSNYDADGSYRNLSLEDIRDYILKLEKEKSCKVGCVVIDHIGALKKKTKDGENQGLMDICHAMKSLAIQTKTFVIMQSQAPRDKAGIGDIELDKDAAYGTVYFESYCDYLMTVWQPLKRCYKDSECPSFTAFKFCKIRAKKRDKDKIQEDTRYLLKFNPETERFQELVQIEEEATFDYWNRQATNLRKQDKRKDLLVYTKIDWTSEGTNGRAADSNKNP